jgi:hypothetical protein
MQISTSVGVDQFIRVSLRFHVVSNLNCLASECKNAPGCYGIDLNQASTSFLA